MRCKIGKRTPERAMSAPKVCRNRGGLARAVAGTLAKQPPQSGECHWTSASAALQHDEQRLCLTSNGSFPTHVVGDRATHQVGQREHAVALALTANAKLALFSEYITDLELQHFGRAQATQQHQVNHREEIG